MSAEHVTAARLARWPDVRQLTELPGPEWRLADHQLADSLWFVRAFEDYIETVSVTEDGLVTASRRHITGRAERNIAAESFVGPLNAVIELLRHPPRREVWPA